jgi:TetR/AcrR family transcriptional regulator, transcriptional repressor of bet genes
MATAVRANPVDKHDQRRQSLADSALRTLGELGYAKASLREIANNSEFSHGVVHYYFSDKLDLIVYGVRRYKAKCVTRYDDAVARSRTAGELLEAFSAKLRETIVDEAPMHRLWYDLRSQSMFEDGLVEAVSQIDAALADMIWRIVVRYAELAGTVPVVDKPSAYGMFDGLFQQALLGYLHRDPAAALTTLDQQVHALLPMLFAS